MTMKKTGKAVKADYSPRKVARVDGWETSDGKMHHNQDEAYKAQADLDLRRVFEGYIAFDDNEYENDEHWSRVKNMIMENRDLIIDLMIRAYPQSEVEIANKRNAGESIHPESFPQTTDLIEKEAKKLFHADDGPDDLKWEEMQEWTREQYRKAARHKLGLESAIITITPAPLSPGQEIDAKAICQKVFNAGWSYRDRWRVTTGQKQHELFDRYWKMMTSDELRHLLPTPAADLRFAERAAFEAGWAYYSNKGGGSVSECFGDWMINRRRVDGTYKPEEKIDVAYLGPTIKEPQVTATPCNGVNMPLDHMAFTYKLISDSLSSQDMPIIGEAVWKAVHAAWRSGIDPALDPFCVIVTFK